MASSTGTSALAGVSLSDWGHVQQSIKKILTTRIGSRVMLREFGSNVPDFIDAKMTRRNILSLYSAVAVAVAKWEPRYNLQKAAVTDANPSGSLSIILVGTYYPNGHLGDYTVAEDKSTRIIFGDE